MQRVDLEQWRAREVARLLALVEAERRYYQEIVASVPVGLAVLADDLTFLSANRTFRTVFELPGEGLARLRLSDIFPDEMVRRRVTQVLQTSMAHRDISVEAAIRGGKKPVRLSIQPFRGWSEEASTEALLLVEEITEPAASIAWEQVQAEAKSDVAEELLESVDAIVWERDMRSLEFTYVSGRTAAVLGFQPEQFLSSPRFLFEHVHPDDQRSVESFYRNASSAKAARSCEYRAYHASGDVVWLRDVVRLRNGTKSLPHKMVGFTTDITAQKRVGEQAAKSEKMAALSRLASRVTHDCNNLLMIMSGYGEELLNNLPPDHPSRDDVGEIISATDRLSKITTELLAFTRRPLLLPKVVDLNTVVEDLQTKLGREVGDRVEVTLDLDPGLSHVNADSEAVANSILRLAESARDAMSAGGRITIRTANVDIPESSTSSGSLAPGLYAAVSVSDTGPAPDEETLTQLFEPFYTGPRAGRALPNVYSVIRNSGGDIEVTSGAEGGATVTIYLPHAQPQSQNSSLPRREEAATTRQRTASPEPAAKPRETVLVVEDEAGIRALMRKILQKQGYHVLEASRGDEALMLSEQHKAPIHLLLTDLVMPQMSGRELADRLKTARPNMKVLFVSGYSDEDLVQHGPLPSGAAFLQKPFSLAALLEKTRTILNGGSSHA